MCVKICPSVRAAANHKWTKMRTKGDLGGPGETATLAARDTAIQQSQLKEKSLQTDIPEDIMALVTKVVKVKKHMEENGKDMTAIRGLRLAESKINRLVKYYKTIGRLPKDWSYDPDRIKLYVE